MKPIESLKTVLLAWLLLLCCVSCGTSRAGESVGNGGPAVSDSHQRGKAISVGEEGDIPLPSNGYLVAEPVGKMVMVDLDGDDHEEELQVFVKKAHRGNGKNTWTETMFSGISVNGKIFADTSAENPMRAFGIEVMNPDPDRFFITDLDTGDLVREIAIPDAGDGNEKATWYFQYQDSKLKYVGVLPGYPDDEISKRDGIGNVMAEGRLSLLQTWYATVSFTLRDGKLEEVPQSWYIPIQNIQKAVTLKRELTVYARPDRKANTVTIKPSRQTVTFPSTDNEHWVQMRLTNGTEGWIYMKDSETILSDGKELARTEVFKNLNLED